MRSLPCQFRLGPARIKRLVLAACSVCALTVATTVEAGAAEHGYQRGDQVELDTVVNFHILKDDKPVGSRQVEEGTTVKVRGVKGDSLLLEFQGLRAIVKSRDVRLPGSKKTTAAESDKAEAEQTKPETEKETETVAVAPTGGDPLEFHARVKPVLEVHCGACHLNGETKGGVNFDELSDAQSILSANDMWRRVKDAVDFEDMPPKPEDTGYGEKERELLMTWIEEKIETINEDDPIFQNPGPAPIRQLTVDEYNRSIRDLFNIDLDIAEMVGIPKEDNVTGFGNLAASLNMQPELLDKYFNGAELVVGLLTGDTAAWSRVPEEHQAAVREQVKAGLEKIFVARPGNGVSEQEASERVLKRFMHMAYRRPVSQKEVNRLLPLVARGLQEKKSFEESIGMALKPVLISPFFLYRVERIQGERGAAEAYPVSDHELATRLSFFLWSSIPDDELLKLAASEKLSEPEVLRAQVKRMLEDPKADALTEGFGAQWVLLDHLEKALPSPRYFPTFDDKVKHSMHKEFTTFFNGLRREDRSVLDLLDADYTYVNEPLAAHYQMEGVEVAGEEMTRVELPEDSARGGLLGMGAILAMTSHTDRTRPTARGEWILRVILGTPPPPPPPDAGTFAAPKDGKEPDTFREKLQQHVSDPNCAGCHEKIDPLGFAMENFDAVGRWRETDGGLPVDNEGKLISGERFKGAKELKEVLWNRRDDFVKNFARQMLTYALGREVEYYDELTLRQIVKELEENDFRFSVLVEEIVLSRPFRYRTNLDLASLN